MIVIGVPDETAILQLQADQQALYFSFGAESLLRRHGLINTRTRSVEKLDLVDPRCRALLTRATQPSPDRLGRITRRPCAFEGPLAPAVLRHLGLHGETRLERQLGLATPDGRNRWTVRRSETMVASPDGAPVPVAEPRAWVPRRVPFQRFDGPLDEVLLNAALDDGSEAPAVFRSGQFWICAFPIFDLGVELLTFPPMQARWRNRIVSNRLHELTATMMEQIVAHLAGDGGMPVVRIAPWPVGYERALSVRHDYDRPISDASLAELLDFYDTRDLKCSVGFLSERAPPEQIRAIRDRGHEIQIHAAQSGPEDFASGFAVVSELAGGTVAGATIHGNDIGFRGDIHYGWFEAAGLRYAELFRVQHLPAPIYRQAPSGVLRRSALTGTPSHYSLDVDTTPQTHRLEHVRQRAAAALAGGALVIAMNHPDINRAALYELLDGIAGPAVWRATMGDIVEWWRITHDDLALDYHGGFARVTFPAPLPQAAVVTIGAAGADMVRHVAPEGCLEAEFPLG
ncbi:MAG: hypothetical protein JO305_08570 [Alphaproteobacteria bacterium]|nr:hypothetical protein [Alphaproteobacteria bacterium]